MFGSQADFTKMPRDSSDWDIGVSMSVWQAISGMLNSHDIVVTKSGVLRIVQDGKTIELQICDIAEKLTRPFYTCAWHPATNTILVKELT